SDLTTDKSHTHHNTTSLLPSPITSSFYPSYCSHPDLHSFPTRRSFRSLPGAHYRRFDCQRARAGKFRCRHDAGGDIGIFLLAPLDRKSTRLNSQSRGHLVCRLLLEKKKNLVLCLVIWVMLL